MKRLLCVMITLGSLFLSCTKEKTDYQSEIEKPVVEDQGFKEVFSLTKGAYNIRLSAVNGLLYKGYNSLRVSFETVKDNKSVFPKDVHFQAIYRDRAGKGSSCPYLYTWSTTDQKTSYYEGYAIFTKSTHEDAVLDLYLSFEIEGTTYYLHQRADVVVQPLQTLGLTEFVGKDGTPYCLALVAPQRPKVGENTLVAGLYQLDTTVVYDQELVYPNADAIAYSPAANHTLLLDPRMPDPSMGNHSSPNNKDLVQGNDGFYYGVVNYTMTGTWALNFRLLNAKGQVQKGTVVPPDFTPGVEGKRSDLFIDIRF